MTRIVATLVFEFLGDEIDAEQEAFRSINQEVREGASNAEELFYEYALDNDWASSLAFIRSEVTV